MTGIRYVAGLAPTDAGMHFSVIRLVEDQAEHLHMQLGKALGKPDA
jgi:hypothetical protein